MKTLRKLLAAMVLTCVLSLTVLAGEIGTGIAQTQPPRAAGDMGTGITAGSAATGEIGTGAASTVDPVSEILLSLLQGVLALF